MENPGDTQDESSLELDEELLLQDNIDDIPVSVEEEEPAPKKKTSKKSKEKKADSKARTASAAVFFNENKSIAGFGNSMRAVFTSVRELVENSLDASEKRGVTPNIVMSLRKLDKKELTKLMGTSITKSKKDQRLDFLEIKCKDNGIGVQRALIPQLFGTVLAGTKYGAQQTRGRFGLGSKMVLLYAMSTLDLPIQITTRPEGEKKTYRVRLFINLEKNEPIINKDEVFVEGDEEYFDDYGTEISVSFTGSWNLAKLYVREYFQQLAIITPYADINVTLPADEGGQEEFLFQRVVDDLPKPPEVVQIHPWGTDISTFRRELTHSTEDNLIDFLANNFMGVDEISAREFFKEVEVDGSKNPQDLTSQEIRRIVHDGFNQALKEAKTEKRKTKRRFKFSDPKGDALSPLGAIRLRKGLEKELNPDFVETLTRDPKAYEGHPFIIEAAIGYGIKGLKEISKAATIVDNRIIYRFANRIPLIFGAGSDLITTIANSIKWSDYGLTRGTETLAIAVSLVSTKIPFPETSKEYIDKVEEIGIEVKLTLEALGRKLRTYLGRSRRRQREKRRKSRFAEYAPDTVSNLLDILKKEGIWNPTTGVSSSRIIAALSSGIPRIDSRIYPPGRPIFGQPIWSTPKIQESLQENGIYEVSSFLRTPNDELSNYLDVTPEKVDQIKRRTITELEFKGDIPELDIGIFMDSEVEKRFHGRDDKGKDVLGLSRLSKALPRRWIRNVYDYLVSPVDQLLKVQALGAKLFEYDKQNVITRLMESSSEADLADDLAAFFGETDSKSSIGLAQIADDALQGIENLLKSDEPEVIITDTDEVIVEQEPTGVGPQMPQPEKIEILLEQLLPPLELIYEIDEVKKRKITSILELLYETAHPSGPIDEKVLSTITIPTFKQNLASLVEYNTKYGEINVTESKEAPKWMDGYLRNAFKRKKINNVSDIIKAEDSVLLEIGELQRTLYSGLLKTLIPEKGEIKEEDILTESAKAKIRILKDAGILTLEQFVSTSATMIEKDEKFFEYLHILIEESKDKLIEHLTVNNDLGSLRLIKDIDVELEEFLIDEGISSSLDLMLKPLDYPNKKLEERIFAAKGELGRGFSGFTKKMEKAFNDAGVAAIDELVYHPDMFLTKELTETSKEELVKAIQILYLPISLISSNLVPTVNVLVDAGVTNIGKFLIWPNSELAQITMMTEEWINLIKESFDVKDYYGSKTPSQTNIEDVVHLIGEQQITVLKEYNIDTVEKLSQIKWGDIFPAQLEEWSEISKLNKLVLSDLEELSKILKVSKTQKAFDTVIKELKKNNIDTILKFIRTPEATIRTTIGTKKRIDLYDEFSSALTSLDEKYFNTETEIYKFFLIYQANQQIKSPIVFLSEFEKFHIDLLNIEGIKTINQLVTYPTKDTAGVLGKSEKAVKDMLASSSLQKAGTSLAIQDNKGKIIGPVITFEYDGTSYFGKEDLDALYSNGYNTLESIFYTADPRTFELPGISWEIINQFKKLLKSPPVFISWKFTRMVKVEKGPQQSTEDDLWDAQSKSQKEELPEEKKQAESSEQKEAPSEGESPEEPQEVEEVYYETFTAKELDSLSKAKVNRVIDFVSSDADAIAKILEWDVAKVKDRQTTIVLQEVGIGLAELEIFRSDHLEHLASLGLSTVEDIYFTTDKESWDSNIIPYEPIQTINKLVNLSLMNAVQELGEEIVNILLENGVNTILDLLLTGDPILEQKTGLPAERFENVKYSLDFGSLINVFDKSVLFAPGVLYHQAQELMSNGYTRIIDLLLEKPTKIAKILDLSKKDVEELMSGMTRSAILKSEEDRGVPLRELNGFSRSDLRSVAKSGIFEMNEVDTLQELLYQVSPEIFQGEQYLLDLTLDIQKICTVPLTKIGDINQDDVELLADHNIHTIGDTLMVSYDDLPTDEAKVNDSLNFVSNSIKDLSPFLAMARLPVSTIMHTSMEAEKEPNLLDVYLNQTVDVDSKAMRNIRSLLQIPVRFTSYYKKYTGSQEDLTDLTIAELLLEYNPEDHPNTLLRNMLHEPGSIVKLMREGSTPIALLDIDANAYRTLLANGYTSIEKILLVDEKYLATITGLTQKYWKNIKDIFDPEVFIARIGDIGLPISVLGLTPEERKELDDMEITYLDQVTVFPHSDGILKKLNNFVHSSIIFLIGTPGEKEISQNADARNIMEAIIVMRNQRANQDVLTEMLFLAWQAYSKNAIELPKKLSEKAHPYGIYCVQDLITYVNTSKDKIPKDWSQIHQLYTESSLLLPLSASDLKEAVNTYRCSTIIDALTCPMLSGEIDSIREEINKGQDLSVRDDLKLSSLIVKKLSGQLYKRIEGLEITLQDILCSPRTIDEYKGVKQKNLNELRQLLKTPLTRFYLENNLFLRERLNLKNYYRLEDIVLNLSKINKNDPEMFKSIQELILSPDTVICSENAINAEIKRSAETILNYPVEGFHELWAATSQGQSVFLKTDTPPVQQIRTYLWKSSTCITNLKSIDSDTVAALFNYRLYTLADILISHDSYLNSIPVLTRKTVKAIQEECVELLDSEESGKSVDLRSIAGKLGYSSSVNSDLGIHLAATPNYHPVYRELVIQQELRDYLKQPLFLVNTDLSIQTLTSLIKKGVNTVTDFLLLPETTRFLSKDIQKLDDRISLLGNDRSIRENFEISELSLSKETQDSVKSKLVGEFVVEALSPGNEEILKQLTIPVNYLDLEENQINQLGKLGVISTFDLFLANPNQLNPIINSDNGELKTYLQNIKFDKLYARLINRPLQVKDFQSISQKGREKLIDQNIHTLMDISDFKFDGFSRNDETVITNAVNLLETDLSVLLSTGFFKIQDISDFEEKGIKSVKELILSRDDFTDELADYLANLTPDKLVKLIDDQQPFSSLPLISKKDEKNILKAGIFTFSTLSKLDIDAFVKLDIKKDKATELKELLLTPWRYMNNISDKLKDIILKREAETVADVLTLNRPDGVNLPEPIEVKKMIKLGSIFTSEPTFIEKFKLETLSDLLHSNNVISAYKSGDEEVVSTIGLLGAHLGNVGSINPKWTAKWVDAGITRVWEYLLAETSDLASIANTSIKVQDEAKEKFKLVSKPKFSIKTAEKEHKEILNLYGFNYYQDLTPKGLLKQFINTNDELNNLVEKYGNALSTPIWLLKPFWDLPKEERAIIASQGKLLLEYLESVDKFNTDIYNSALNGEVVESKALKEVLHQSHAKQVSKDLSVEEYIYSIYRREAEFSDISNYLKTPLELFDELTPKEVLVLYRSQIATLADLLLQEKEKLLKILGVKAERLDGILSNLSSIKEVKDNLPPLGLVPSTMSDAFREAGFRSWSAIVSGLTVPEVKDLRGLSINSVNSVVESSKFPISLSYEFRNLSLDLQRQLTGFGIRTFLDLLVVGQRVSELITNNAYSSLLENSSKASYNKANKEIKTSLTLSSSVTKATADELNNLGIQSPIDIAMGNYDLEGEITDAVESWMSILQTPISDLQLPPKLTIKSDLSTLDELVVKPDDSLKKIGFSNSDISVFRGTLFLGSKQVKKPSTSNGSKPSKTTTKKSTSKAKKPTKKTPTKESTKKASKKSTKKTKKKATKASKKSTKKSSK